MTSSSPHSFIESFWFSPPFALESLMAVVETLPGSSSLLRSFHFWNLHHPLVPLMGLIVFAPLVEGGSTHFATMVIRLLILLALVVWCLRIFELGKLTPVPINLWRPISLY